MRHQQIICVLGMHRSGTSLVSRILNLLGVYLGPDAHIMQPGPDNPKGYWEHWMITALNDEILARLGGSWHEPPAFPPAWEISPELADLRQRARAILQEDFATAELWGWKDPRTCLTLPFWQKLLPPMRYVICLRNPVDIARSLERRNNFSFEKGSKLWLTYVISALQHTGGHPRLFIFYEDLMRDWPREVRRLAGFLGKPELVEQEAIQQSIQEFVEQELQHHRTSLIDAADEPKLPFPAKALYMVLHTYATYQHQQPDWEVEDATLQRALDVFGSYALEAVTEQERLAQLVTVLREQVAQLGQRAEAFYAQLQESAQERERLTQHAQALQAQLAAVQAQAEAERATLTQQLAEKEQTIQQLQAQLAEQQQALQQLQTQLVSLQQRLSWKRYRIADRLLSYYWYLWHPKQAWQRAKARAWELGRRWLPYSAKRWIKQFILKQAPVAGTPSPNAVAPTGALISKDQTLAFKVPKLPTYDVIYFPIIDWDFRYQRSQHLCSQFAWNGHRVFYLKTTFIDSQSGLRLRAIKDHIYEIQLPGPLGLNIYRHRISSEVLDLFFESFQQLRREHSIHEAVCIVALPFWKPIAVKLREAFGWKVIYDCMDQHKGFSTNNIAMLAEESELSCKSDLVVTTSRTLYEEQKQYNHNCLLLPNAADFRHFSVCFGEIPPLFNELQRPIVGYYGAISDWFDVELVRYLASKRREWSFVLIGSTFGADVAPLQGMPNVHLLGEQPYETLPKYLHQFDACIIPFKLNILTKATNPVKFFEFLSAGKPVVSVPLPELLPYAQEGLVYIGDTPSAFLDQLERALKENNMERIQARMKFAAQQTWEERFSVLQKAVRALYPKASIIVLTKDNLHMTRLCLESIFRNTLYPNFEVVVVDNASTDGTQEYLKQLMKEHINLKVIFNTHNEGFARANNQGIMSASGDYIVLLNNDTIVTRGWLGRLIRYLERDPSVGMVGPVTNFAGNEAKIVVPYSSLSNMEKFADQYVFAHEGQSFEIKMLAMFCVAMRRSLLMEVGLLDERFGIGMFEDDDYAYRVKLQGYKLVCAEDVFIHHFGMSTMKKMSEQKYLELFESNRKKFEKKWDIRWEPHKYREEGLCRNP